MKHNGLSMLLSAAVVLALATGCEWEQADSFNTSRGGGGSVNFSGVYSQFSRAAVSGTGITRLIITQTGNRIEVWDNQNNYYSGSVGSPGVVSQPNVDGTYAAGAEILQSQLSFSGGDVQFMGMVRAVAVTDIEAETVSTTYGDSDTHTEGKTDDETDTQTTTDGDTTTFNTESTATTTTGDAENGTTDTSTLTYEEETTHDTTTSDTEGETETDASTKSRTRSEGYTHEYALDQSNTHYVLEGNWMQGGTLHEVHAWSHASNVSTFSSTTATGTTATQTP